MGTLRFVDLQTRPTEVLDLTSLTLEEFQTVPQLPLHEWGIPPTLPRRSCSWPSGVAGTSKS
jgi:hypothetical protein